MSKAAVTLSLRAMIRMGFRFAVLGSFAFAILISAGCKCFPREETLEDLQRRNQEQRALDKMWFRSGPLFNSK